MKSDHYIEADNLSVAWARAVQTASQKGVKEVSPLTVSITFKEGVISESRPIRRAVDEMLAADGKQTVETVANTIFPNSLWNPSALRSQLFERYERALPKIKSSSRKNSFGLYFERMVTGGKATAVNQLEEVIAAYEARKGARRSLLQVATFFPHVDHSRSAQRGFPCLQHVTFTPTKEGGLNVNAFYASQYLCERGYGNYLGLARLGKFVAHELKLPLRRLTCLIGVAELETNKNQVLSVLSALAAEGGEDES